MSSNHERNTCLPTRRNLRLMYLLPSVIAALLVAASISGILPNPLLYPTDDLLQSFIPRDVVNLAIGLPILLGAMWLARRGKLIGLLLWPGAVFYVLLNVIAYFYSLPLTVVLLIHLGLVMPSVHILASLLARIDGDRVQPRLSGAVPERIAGGVTAGRGLLFFLRVAGAIIGALVNQTSIAETELGLRSLTSRTHQPSSLMGVAVAPQGVQVRGWSGLALPGQHATRLVGRLLLDRPFLTVARSILGDVIVILVPGLICYSPFTLYARGVASERRLPPS